MDIIIIPDPEFMHQAKRLAKKYRSLKEDLNTFINELKKNPFLGTNLGNNTYKVRMAILSKGKGKSGGARIITYVITLEDDNYKVRLLTIYNKNEIENVSTSYLRTLISNGELE